MNDELRAVVKAWRDAPGPDTSARAERALRSAGVLEPGQVLGGPEDAALWLDVLDEAPPLWSADVRAALDAEAGDVVDLGASFDPAGAEVGRALVGALRADAGEIDVADAVLAAVEPAALPEGWLAGLLDAALPPDVRELATRRVADDPELRRELALHAEVGRRLREGVIDEAGDLREGWARVAPELGFADGESVPGWDGRRVADAVRAEAGSVDVADAVVARLRREAEAPIPDEPQGLGQGWMLAAVAMTAAAAMLSVVVPAIYGVRPETEVFEERTLSFASADELALEGARYGEHASVFVELPGTPDAPVIVWVDDGAQL